MARQHVVAIQVDPGGKDTRVELNTIQRPGFIGVHDSGTPHSDGREHDRRSARPWRPLHRSHRRHHHPGGGPRRAHPGQRRAPPGTHLPGRAGAGIHVFGARFTVAFNVVSEMSGADGIGVEPSARGTSLTANVTTRNGDDGIDIESRVTTVTANVADDNIDLGIEAVDGVTDGGGNRSSGNGNRAQCVGLACS